MILKILVTLSCLFITPALAQDKDKNNQPKQIIFIQPTKHHFTSAGEFVSPSANFGAEPFFLTRRKKEFSNLVENYDQASLRLFSGKSELSTASFSLPIDRREFIKPSENFITPGFSLSGQRREFSRPSFDLFENSGEFSLPSFTLSEKSIFDKHKE